MNTETQSLLPAIEEFVRTRKSLTLATVSDTGEPHASYAPFLWHGQKFYIFVSQLAVHTKNLSRQTPCHVMLIRDESQSPNVFARERLSLQCHVECVPRDSQDFEPLMERMGLRFGPVIANLQSLPDFSLFALAPQHGVYVQGFAQAHPISFID